MAAMAASALVEMRPMNHVSVRFRIAWIALFAANGTASAMIARTSTRVRPDASSRCAGKDEDEEATEGSTLSMAAGIKRTRSVASTRA
jgi:hypothetical protein